MMPGSSTARPRQLPLPVQAFGIALAVLCAPGLDGCARPEPLHRQLVGEISARVRIDGRAVEGQAVVFRWFEDRWTCRTLSLVTDTEGGVRGNVPWTDCRIDVAKPGYVTVHQWLEGCEVALGRPITLDLTPAAPVAGVVVDRRGDPIIGARIHTVDTEHPRLLFGEAASGDGGRFCVSEVPAGARLQLRVAPPGDSTTLQPATLSTVAPATSVSVTLDDAGVVFVSVTDADGRRLDPYAGPLHVETFRDGFWECTTELHLFDRSTPGRAVVGGLASGNYRFKQHRPGVGSACSPVVVVKAGEGSELTLVVDSRSLSGKVLDPEGEVIAAVVALEGLDVVAHTSPDGSFLVAEAPTEMAELTVAAEGFLPRTIVVPDSISALGTIRLERGP